MVFPRLRPVPLGPSPLPASSPAPRPKTETPHRNRSHRRYFACRNRRLFTLRPRTINSLGATRKVGRPMPLERIAEWQIPTGHRRIRAVADRPVAPVDRTVGHQSLCSSRTESRLKHLSPHQGRMRCASYGAARATAHCATGCIPRGRYPPAALIGLDDDAGWPLPAIGELPAACECPIDHLRGGSRVGQGQRRRPAEWWK